MRKHWLIYALLAVVAACLLSLLVYNLPPVHSRLAWRVDSAQEAVQAIMALTLQGVEDTLKLCSDSFVTLLELARRRSTRGRGAR